MKKGGLSTVSGNPKAVKKYEVAMAVNESKLDATVVANYEAVMATARLTKASACLMEAMTGQKEGSKVRQLVQTELKELRGHIGKSESEKRLLPILKEKAERVLEGN